MATIKLPENLCKGVKIRTGYYTGSMRHTKAIDTTAETLEALHAAGWAARRGNDAPKGGVTGNYVEIIGKLWSKATLRKKVKEAILTADFYRGAIVYRLAISNGKIVAALPEGFHGSCLTPYYTTAEEWAAECRRQMGKLGAIIKADGSCGRFYVRPEYVPTAEANGLSLDIYDVEAMFGGTITNYEIITNSNN